MYRLLKFGHERVPLSAYFLTLCIVLLSIVAPVNIREMLTLDTFTVAFIVADCIWIVGSYEEFRKLGAENENNLGSPRSIAAYGNVYCAES